MSPQKMSNKKKKKQTLTHQGFTQIYRNQKQAVQKMCQTNQTTAGR